MAVLSFLSQTIRHCTQEALRAFAAFLALLGAYWGHLYAQTRNVLVPVSMHAVWNAFTLGVGACVVSGG